MAQSRRKKLYPQTKSVKAVTPRPKSVAPKPEVAHPVRTRPRVWLERVYFIGFDQPQQLLFDERGCLEAFAPQAEDVDWLADRRVDYPWSYLSLSGLDLQINGVLGLPFPYVNDDEFSLFRLEQACRFLASEGVYSFLPTIVTCSQRDLQNAFKVFAGFTTKPYAGARILGIHLEGPFLNPDKRGAHPAQHLVPLTVDNVKRVLGDYASLVKLITLAPELDTTGTVIPYLRELGIAVSLGHSQATASQAQAAFDQGVTMLTHAFNAMPALHHRQPGPLAAAIADPRVSYGLIADGQHVDPLMIELLLRTDRPGEQGTFLVSDALAPLGLESGVYPWDQGRNITITKGTARLEDGTLAGTTLPLLVGVKNLVKWGSCDPDVAIFRATMAPRLALNLPGLDVGVPAYHLLAWEYEPEHQRLIWEDFSIEYLLAFLDQ